MFVTMVVTNGFTVGATYSFGRDAKLPPGRYHRAAVGDPAAVATALEALGACASPGFG